jgi:acyl carrier protein
VERKKTIECMRRAMAEYLKIDPRYIQMDTDLFRLVKDLGGDECDIRAMFDIAEEECNIELPNERIRDYPTLRHIINYVDMLLA